MKDIIENGFTLALKWHGGQTRKVDGSPYLPHPVMVAVMLAQNGFSDETIAAGFCHDLLEDTKCSEEEIVNACGKKVLEIVQAVSNQDLKDWKKKKLLYIESVRKGPIEAKAVCCADKIHNMRSMIDAYSHFKPEEFWKKFNAGRGDKEWFEKEVLKMLKKTWNHPMISELEKLTKEAREKLI